MKNYIIEQMDEIESTQCPCGTTRRAFVHPDNHVATIHMVDISKNSRIHYHKKLTEIYLILEGTGHMELDGELVPVKPMTSIFIKPGCRHRAIGKMRIVNIPIPAFDPTDEWFDG
jgi:mannose-6-phosphate isomerase-like protein (cupin superfamily)